MNEMMDLSMKVLTLDGERKISSLEIGDNVIDYITGQPIKVESVARMAVDSYASIVYSDGRGLNVPLNQFLFDGSKPVDYGTFRFKHNYKTITDLPVYSYEFRNYNNLFDPYLVGMLYAYGKWGNNLHSRINLPCSVIEAYDKLAKNTDHEYLLSDEHVKDDGYVEFLKFSKTILDRFVPRKIRYQDIIYPEYEREYKSLDKRPIPSRYLYSTKETRIKFLAGVFGFGNVAVPEDTGEITLFCDNDIVVNEILKMIRSLGIVATSRANVQIERIKYGTDYQIRILKRNNKVPEFIYDVDLIHKIVENTSSKDYATIPYFNLVPTFIQEHATTSFMYNITCDRPHRIFTTSNFLPIVSL